MSTEDFKGSEMMQSDAVNGGGGVCAIIYLVKVHKMENTQSKP